MKRVYCEDCIYLSTEVGSGSFCCEHYKNVVKVDTWLCRQKDYAEHPSVLNAKNDCGWFIEK